MNKISKTFKYGDADVTIETGVMARQADSSVVVKMGEMVILATLVYEKNVTDDAKDFFPLTVNYQEKAYALGRIPGGFIKREGRPSEREIRHVGRDCKPPANPSLLQQATEETGSQEEKGSFGQQDVKNVQSLFQGCACDEHNHSLRMCLTCLWQTALECNHLRYACNSCD